MFALTTMLPGLCRLSFVLYLSLWANMLSLTVYAAEKGSLVESFDGAVSCNEVESFNDYFNSLNPATSNNDNNWAQGYSGEQNKALGLVYMISRNQTTLDHMIRYCDALLSERNDLAKEPLGQQKIWTGKISPVFLPAAGGEQGDCVGHLASCAYLILDSKSLYDLSLNDPHDYGNTYLKRAKRYLREADFTMDQYILSSLLDLSHDWKMYFSKESPYMSGNPVPWNQQMMFNYALQNLCDAHRILDDNKALLAKYKSIIEASFQWFFSGGGSHVKTLKGTEVYDWSYAFPGKSAEDSNHGALDVAGFARPYITRDYNITEIEMKTFANTFVDVMTLDSAYAGRIDGTSKTTNGKGHQDQTEYVRSGHLFLAEFRPDAYESMMKGAYLKVGERTTDPGVFSGFLWVKQQLHLKKHK